MGIFTVYPIFLAHMSRRISIGEVSKGTQSIQELPASSLSLSNLSRFRFRSAEAGLGLREVLQEILTYRLRWARTNRLGFAPNEVTPRGYQLHLDRDGRRA